MYLGLIQVVNADLQHRYPAERADGGAHSGGVRPQLRHWLGKIFSRKMLEKTPGKQT
jgi:hypothetical protein